MTNYIASGLAGFVAALAVVFGVQGISHSSTGPAASPEPAPIAAAVCAKPDTVVRQVHELANHDPSLPGWRYEARYQDKDTRYDLTWRPGGTVVAVEELRGTKVTARVEFLPDELAACVAGKTVEVIHEGN